MMLAYISSLSL